MAMAPTLRKSPAAHVQLLLAERDQPQDGGQGAGYGEIRSQVHADQYRIGNQSPGMLRLQCCAGD